MPNETIYPDGDVIISAGADDNLYNFQVSSVILTTASPVFRAMYLKSNFTEGQDLLIHGTSSLRFEEDVDAVRTVLQCLHHNFDQSPITTTDAMLKVAVLADKYDCIPLIAHFVRENCERFMRSLGTSTEDDSDADGWMDVLTTAYLTRMMDIFERSSLILVQHFVDNYQSMLKERRQWVSDFVILWLEVSRSNQRSIYQAWIISALTLRCFSLDEGHPASEALRSKIEHRSDWPKLWTIGKYIMVHQEFSQKAMEFAKDYCEGCDGPAADVPLMGSDTIAPAQRWTGLCLKCCLRRDGDPYDCEGGCEDPKVESEVEEEADTEMEEKS
ncbi:hypothetical protein BDZ85DRAFT_293091 [Elsinoe ampelina]|uniref:BTB domain-containing protein n=1 Tax=Elsinoe ampelina TaxID=302913 RepID=A0A6A6GRA4_9PEZI|nr:hypothetical protein BDZ85DRAFT_293091 [Elsinoe ampelina]